MVVVHLLAIKKEVKVDVMTYAEMYDFTVVKDW